MPNLRVVHNNVANQTSSLVASTTAGSLVASNLLNDRKTEIWRATGTSATLTLTWGVARAVSMVALAFTNLSPTATIAVDVYTLSSDGSPAFSTGAILCCPANLGYASPVGFGGGTYADAWFESHTGQKIVITVTDSSNPIGYIEAGRIVVGAYWSPDHDAESDSVKMTMQDDSKHTRSESGVLWTDRGPMYKKLSFDLSYMTASDRDAAWKILAGNGMFNSMYVSMMPDSSDTNSEQIHTVYGRLTSASVVQYKYMHMHATQLQIEEI